MQVKVTTSVITQDPPAKCSEDVQGVVETVADAVVGKHGSMHMVSRAYHDSLFIAQKVPTGMVFIPCAHGHSHRPDESASEEDMGIGVQVLAGTIAQLAAGEEVRNTVHEEL
jgi:ureidoglycolate amidohydrolase